MGNKRPTPEHLAAKILAIRKNFGLGQHGMARLLRVEPYTRLSEFERGRRVPSFRVLIRYARLAGIPLEFIVDDGIDLDYFKKYLKVAESKRGELNDPPESTEHHITLFWRTSSASSPEDEHKCFPCPGCGGPLEKDAVSGRYECYDCDHEWEAWEVLHSLE